MQLLSPNARWLLQFNIPDMFFVVVVVVDVLVSYSPSFLLLNECVSEQES